MFKVGDIVTLKNSEYNDKPFEIFEIMIIDDENFVYIKPLNSKSSLYKLISIKSIELSIIYLRRKKLIKLKECLK